VKRAAGGNDAMRRFDRALLKNKIHGCLAALAVGDALGYPAHEMTREEIERRFGGRLVSFHSPFGDNPYHPHDMRPGQITDDTLMTLLVAESLVRWSGEDLPDAAYFGRAFGEWAKADPLWERSPMFGPTTKKRFRRLADGEDAVTVGTSGNTSTDGATNGAAMRVSPAGLFCPSDVGGAVELAVRVSLPTHGTSTAIAGACAIAAGVAEAFAGVFEGVRGANVLGVAKAAIAGAREGDRIARLVGRSVPAPDTALRIEMAVSAALEGGGSIHDACAAVADRVGSGMLSYEAVPAAVGVFVATGGDPELAAVGGANIGGDTDTIASMACALSGALSGIDRVPVELYREVERVNGLDLESLAERFTSAVCERLNAARGDEG
jgi:ADP-ribosylglycohydrolase